MKKWTFLLLILASLVFSVACSIQEIIPQKQDAAISKTEFMLNTVITVKLYGTNDESLITPIFAKARELENLLSAYIDDSDISQININAGIQPTIVSEKTYNLIKNSFSYMELSNGLFDITIGPLVELWSIDPPTGHVPTNDELAIVLPLIDYTKIQLNDSDYSIFLSDKEMMINLGAIAKGFIVDEMVNEVEKVGIESAIINAGGNIYALGSKTDGSNFNIGIQDPNSDRGEYLGILSTSDKSVVTSGDYERFFIEDGVKYHHILDPTTGYPVTNKIKSVSIISDKSIDGDALSTTTLLLGLEKGQTLINSLEGIEAIFVTTANEIYITGDIGKDFKLTNKDYTIIK